MERAHDGSKAEEKAKTPPVQAQPATHVASDARRVLGLQRSAGNRAVAQMLASGASGARTRPPTVDAAPGASGSPITVQRDLDQGIKAALPGTKMDDAFYLEFADKLVQKVYSDSSSSGKQSTTTTKKATTGGAAVAKIPSKTENEEREKALTHQLTPDEINQQLKSKQLDLDEERKKINDRITALQKGPTEEEAKLEAQSDELDVLEEQKQKQKDLEQLKRKRSAEARLLNPGGKRLSGLMKGRSL
jgi:hypothetical protein